MRKIFRVGAAGTVGLAEDFLGAVAGEHLVGVGRGAGELGLVELLKRVGLGAAVKAGKRPRAATHHVIVDIGRRTGGVVRDVREPVKRPFGAEV